VPLQTARKIQENIRTTASNLHWRSVHTHSVMWWKRVTHSVMCLMEVHAKISKSVWDMKICYFHDIFLILANEMYLAQTGQIFYGNIWQSVCNMYLQYMCHNDNIWQKSRFWKFNPMLIGIAAADRSGWLETATSIIRTKILKNLETNQLSSTSIYIRPAIYKKSFWFR